VRDLSQQITLIIIHYKERKVFSLPTVLTILIAVGTVIKDNIDEE